MQTWSGILIIFLASAGCSSKQTPSKDAGLEADLARPDTSPTLDASADIASATCSFREPVVQAEINDARITEVSGLAVSPTQDAIWIHNDSGMSAARFYAVSREGATLGVFDLAGATFEDWEDASLTVENGTTYLYFGDVGDNDARNGVGGRTSVFIYRVAEPDLNGADPNIVVTINTFETYEFTYPDAPHDCETIMVDPMTQDIYLVAKENAGPTNLYRASKPADGQVAQLELIGDITFGRDAVPGVPFTTAGAISGDRTSFAIRTYGSIVLWDWPPGESLAEATARAPTEIPRPIREILGEAIDFVEGGVITIAEGNNPKIHFMERICE